MKMKHLIILLALDLFFVLLHIFFGSQFDLFNLDRERTPAAFFSAIQFIGSAYAAATLYVILRGRREKILFSCLSLLFAFMAFDEISELHENIAYYLIQYAPSFSFFGSKTAMWLIFLSPLIVSSFILIAIAIRKIARHALHLGFLLLSGTLFFGLALSLEFFGNSNGFQSLLPLLIPLEEAFELIGGTLFLFALASYAKEIFSTLYQKK